jgi:hypothetical protein
VGPFGAKGIGEQALIPTAPAILNAICHACGLRVMQTPATPRSRRACGASKRGAYGHDADLPAPVQGDKIRCDACPVLCFIREGMRAPATATPMQRRLVRSIRMCCLKRTRESGGEAGAVPALRRTGTASLVREPRPS